MNGWEMKMCQDKKMRKRTRIKSFFLSLLFSLGVTNTQYTKISNKVCGMRTKRILFIQYYIINTSEMYLSLSLILLLISFPTFCWDSQANDFHSYIHTHTVRIYDFNFELNSSIFHSCDNRNMCRFHFERGKCFSYISNSVVFFSFFSRGNEWTRIKLCTWTY